LKIKRLELELARVKLELVDAQCKNQEFDHLLKGYLNSSSQDSNSSKPNGNNNNHGNIFRSNSTASQENNGGPPYQTMSSSLTSLNSSASNTASNTTLNNMIGAGNSNGTNGNNWLSKTFTTFKEATNNVVQKAAQKATK
jgi:hypothetical protein